MPEGTSTDYPSARPLPVALPPVAPAPGDWDSRGRCVGEDPDLFFPSHGDPGTKARAICAACAVRSQCLDYAVEADEYGIWGGLDQVQRRNMKRQRRRRTLAKTPRASEGRR